MEILDGKGRVICSGALIGPSRVVSAAHCFGDANPSHYKIRVGPKDFQVAGIALLPAGELPFPNGDVARLDLEGAVPATWPIELAADADAPSDGMPRGKLQAFGFGGNRPEASNLRFVRALDGYRVRRLAEVEVTHGKRLCRGDSGGPVYFRRGNKEVLLGVVSGRLEGLGRFAEKCTEASDLITMLPAYRAWLKADAMPTLDPPAQSRADFATLDEACKASVPGSPEGIFVDEILQRYVRYMRLNGSADTDFADVYLKCAQMDKVSVLLAKGDIPAVARRAVTSTVLPLLKLAATVEGIDGNDDMVAVLVQLPNLRNLALSGLRWHTSLKQLSRLRLQSLTIRYSPCIVNLETVDSLRKAGTAVKLDDVKACR